MFRFLRLDINDLIYLNVLLHVEVVKANFSVTSVQKALLSMWPQVCHVILIKLQVPLNNFLLFNLAMTSKEDGSWKCIAIKVQVLLSESGGSCEKCKRSTNTWKFYFSTVTKYVYSIILWLLDCAVFRSIGLKPVAAVSVRLYAGGQELQVQGPIQFSVPLGSGTRLRASDTMPAWSFNLQTGRRHTWSWMG